MTRFNMFTDEELDASEVGVEIVKTEETEKSGIKYLNINVSNSEVERNPNIVRIAADAGILEYVKSSGDSISRQAVIDSIKRYFHDEYYQRTSIQDCRDCLIEDVIKDIPPVTPQPKTDVLDKITKEIEEVQTYDGIYIDRAYVLEIIDKYRGA